MPLTFPAHQGLILPMAHKWPDSFDALALSVGAAMPDITDSALGFLINGYFKQWYGHTLVGIFTLDLLGGLLITWLITVFAPRLLKYADLPKGLQALFTKAPPKSDSTTGRNIVHSWRTRFSLRSFSVFVGILSHLGFDLISHDTNLLLYPWNKNLRWFPGWWYTTWFEIPSLPMFRHSSNSQDDIGLGLADNTDSKASPLRTKADHQKTVGHSYSVGFFTVTWGILTLIGIFLFFRFLSPKYKNRM